MCGVLVSRRLALCVAPGLLALHAVFLFAGGAKTCGYDQVLCTGVAALHVRLLVQWEALLFSYGTHTHTCSRCFARLPCVCCAVSTPCVLAVRHTLKRG